MSKIKYTQTVFAEELDQEKNIHILAHKLIIEFKNKFKNKFNNQINKRMQVIVDYQETKEGLLIFCVHNLLGESVPTKKGTIFRLNKEKDRYELSPYTLKEIK